MICRNLQASFVWWLQRPRLKHHHVSCGPAECRGSKRRFDTLGILPLYSLTGKYSNYPNLGASPRTRAQDGEIAPSSSVPELGTALFPNLKIYFTIIPTGRRIYSSWRFSLTKDCITYHILWGRQTRGTGFERRS